MQSLLGKFDDQPERERQTKGDQRNQTRQRDETRRDETDRQIWLPVGSILWTTGAVVLWIGAGFGGLVWLVALGILIDALGTTGCMIWFGFTFLAVAARTDYLLEQIRNELYRQRHR